MAIVEASYYTQCTYWATLLPVDGGPGASAVIVGYEPLGERDKEYAPARVTLQSRGGELRGRTPEAGRPPTLPTDVVVLEPADPGAALLRVARPEGLDASGEVVAVVSFQGADGPPELVFVREQRGERACLLQYLELGQLGWTLHADSCVEMKRPTPSDEHPHPSPKGEELPGPSSKFD